MDECDIAREEGKHWHNDLKVGDEVVVEQPMYRFRYYPTTVNKVTSAGVLVKGFPSVLFRDGMCQIGSYKYRLLKPTNKLLDIINLINIRKQLVSTNWSKVDDDIVTDVWELVCKAEYGGY